MGINKKMRLKAPIMGREVEEDRVEEMPLLPHQVRSHV